MLRRNCNPLMQAALVLAACAAALAACAGRAEPPFITAAVTNVYREVYQVDDFALIYWWEERGETPFLKPYSLRSKELIVETAIPLDDDPQRVDIRTRHIPLRLIDTIDIVLTDYGKDIIVGLAGGERVIATNRFPRSLKKGAQTGLADHKVYVSGIVKEGSENREFKVELDLIKSIKILSVRESR